MIIKGTSWKWLLKTYDFTVEEYLKFVAGLLNIFTSNPTPVNILSLPSPKELLIKKFSEHSKKYNQPIHSLKDQMYVDIITYLKLSKKVPSTYLNKNINELMNDIKNLKKIKIKFSTENLLQKLYEDIENINIWEEAKLRELEEITNFFIMSQMNISKICNPDLGEEDYEYLWLNLMKSYKFYDKVDDYFPVDLTIPAKDLIMSKQNKKLAKEPYIIEMSNVLKNYKCYTKMDMGYPDLISFPFVQKWLMGESYTLWVLLNEVEKTSTDYNKLIERYEMMLITIAIVQEYFTEIHDYYVTDKSYMEFWNILEMENFDVTKCDKWIRFILARTKYKYDKRNKKK
jgi:hypothetical protein